MTDQDAESGIGRRRALARDSNNALYKDRRAEIIAAAATLFKKKGYRGTSLADIGKEIGADRASIYYYFGSKEEIFDTVVTDVVVNNLRVAERIRDSDKTPTSKLRELVVKLMVSYEEHYPFLYVYLQENMAHVSSERQNWAKSMRSVNRRYEKAVQEIIEQGIASGEFRSLTDPQVLAFGVMGIVSWTNRWFNPATTTVNAQAIGEAYAEILIQGLAGPSGK
ncbi:hypothetical protein GQ85_08480 [Rhodococcus rhodochrous]|nr:hypothetical protein GQ85_08480 [Rhodococcus rhodochrous]